MFKSIITFIKKETVLSIALFLAVVSAFLVHPDRQYIAYIDFRTLGLLFCLMTVMAGYQEMGVFAELARKLLERTKSMRSVVLILVGLCFFFSMLITNDVALITFVPLALIVLDFIGQEEKRRWIIPVVVMQTIAANLGSMLTPIGNPQNLYLYGRAQMGLGEFLLLMLPYSMTALVGLLVWSCFLCRRETGTLQVALAKREQKWSGIRFAVYSGMFLLCLLTVARVLPYGVTLAVVLLMALFTDRSVLMKVDYSLLLTFVGFFVFIGNMGRVDAFRQFLESVIEEREIWTAIAASQVMSNVPAALLLSGFTQEYDKLIIGTNLGGLGTLIASMASLISFKYIGREEKSARGRYLISFTVSNLVFLAILAGLGMVINSL